MKALIMKDFNLLKGQKQFFGAVALMMVLFAVVQNNPTFSITYVTLIFSILVMTTMGYDDFENGMCYLMTLPVSRREYVRAKYIFGIVSGVFGFAASSFFSVAAFVLKGRSFPWEEWQATAVACVLLMTLVLGITTPIQLKFGSEKSKIAILGVYGVGCLGAYVVMKLCEGAGIDLERLLESAIVENLLTTVWGIGIISAAILVISCLISVRILEKREL